MKNINYVINGVLAVAVVILFVMQFSGKKEASVAPVFAENDDSTTLLPIAYVNVDSLLANYYYAKDLGERIVKKQEDFRASLGQDMRNLQNEAMDFQRKLENNAFMTTERAEQENRRLMKKKQDLDERAAKMDQELSAEQLKLNEQLRDTIVSQLTEFNKTKGYQIIFSNSMGDNILIANHAYDITAELLDILNKNYVPSTATPTK